MTRAAAESTTAPRRLAGAVHASRTIMVSELELLLAAQPPDASLEEYRGAILDENVLGKASRDGRVKSERYLRQLYALDPRVRAFSALRRVWDDDAAARPLAALLVALSRDIVLAASADVVLDTPVDTRVTPQEIAAALASSLPGALGEGTRLEAARRCASSWTQSSHLVGGVVKVRRRAVPQTSDVALACFLACEEGRCGEQAFASRFAKALDLNPAGAGEAARSAGRSGWLRIREVGRVVSIDFPVFGEGRE